MKRSARKEQIVKRDRTIKKRHQLARQRFEPGKCRVQLLPGLAAGEQFFRAIGQIRFANAGLALN